MIPVHTIQETTTTRTLRALPVRMDLAKFLAVFGHPLASNARNLE